MSCLSFDEGRQECDISDIENENSSEALAQVRRVQREKHTGNDGECPIESMLEDPLPTEPDKRKKGPIIAEIDSLEMSDSKQCAEDEVASQDETAVSQEASGNPDVSTVDVGRSPVNDSPGIFDFDQLEMSIEIKNKSEQSIDMKEDDDASMADSDDLPGHVDSDSEEEMEPEWIRRKRGRRAQAPPPPINR